jgi:uncharacterized protein (TIGR00251 family)
MAEYYTIEGNRLFLYIKAVPGSSKTEFAGVKDNRLRVRIAAAPEAGKANNELIAFLAKSLACTKREIVLLSGERSRLKTLFLPVSVQQKLEGLDKR